ncbi:DUF5050 domain-containing protein [Oligoflexaceae bacterium]|nr:DUF5050 domain-containing protein [Oligoflexaceae bacterium]
MLILLVVLLSIFGCTGSNRNQSSNQDEVENTVEEQEKSGKDDTSSDTFNGVVAKFSDGQYAITGELVGVLPSKLIATDEKDFSINVTVERKFSFTLSPSSDQAVTLFIKASYESSEVESEIYEIILSDHVVTTSTVDVKTPVAKTIVWSDGQDNSISSVGLDVSEVNKLASTPEYSTAVVVEGTQLYFGPNGITRSNLDGSSKSSLIAQEISGYVLSIKIYGSKIYWTDSKSNSLRRANLSDGSTVETLYTPADGEVQGFAIAPNGSTLFLGVWHGFYESGGIREHSRLLKMGLDGSGVAIVRAGFKSGDSGNYYDDAYIMNPLSMIVDSTSTYLYVTDIESKLILRYTIADTTQTTRFQSSNGDNFPLALYINGTNIVASSFNQRFFELCLSYFDDSVKCETSYPLALAESPIGIFRSGSSIYFLNKLGAVKKISDDFDISTLTELAPSVLPEYTRFRGVAHDRYEDLVVYGTNHGLWVSKTDGSEYKELTPGGEYVYDIELDYDNKVIYFADYGDALIYKVNYDGTGLEIVLDHSSEASNISGIGLDVKNSKIYFSDSDGSHNVLVANLDGSSPERLTSLDTATTDGNHSVLVRDVDVVGDKLYIVGSGGSQTLGKVNLDGTGYEKILDTNCNTFCGLSVDLNSSRIYYSKGLSINYSSLDGSGETEVVSENIFNARYLDIDSRP